MLDTGGPISNLPLELAKTSSNRETIFSETATDLELVDFNQKSIKFIQPINYIGHQVLNNHKTISMLDNRTQCVIYISLKKQHKQIKIAGDRTEQNRTEQKRQNTFSGKIIKS